MGEFASRWGRRSITILGCWLVCAGLVLCLPLWLVAALIWDMGVHRQSRAVRFGFFVTLFSLCEAVGILCAFLLWFTLLLPQGRAKFVQRNYRLCWAWAGSVFFVLRKIYRVQVSIEGAEVLTPGPYLLLMRHISAADALLPTILVSRPHCIYLKHVFKRELLWDPCLDIVGNRLGHYFVRRGAGEAEKIMVGNLARGLKEQDGMVLFPEGTRFTPAKRTAMLEKLSKHDPELYAHGLRLQHSLIPRSGGMVHVLREHKELDVIFATHTGLESITSIASLFNGALLGRHIRVRFWRVKRSLIPKEASEQAEWLLQEWTQVDAFNQEAA